MQNIINQIREAREKATQGEWKYAIDAPYVKLGDSNVMLQVNSPDEARYITLLHNSILEILDALEEAERKAKAGEELAEAVKKEFTVDYSRHVGATEVMELAKRMRSDRLGELLDTYNKTVNK